MLPQAVLPLLTLALTATAPLGAPQARPVPAAWPPDALPARPPAETVFMDLDDVAAGQRAVAYTVFTGDQVEPFAGRVLGVLDNFMGPQRDIVLVEFEGERIRHTGVVHGMSGSPVYIDGQLLGALSLTLSPFPKDPVAGVTPIHYMLDEARQLRDVQSATSRTAPPKAVLRGSSSKLGGAFAEASPLKAPLVITGATPGLIEEFSDFWDQLGLVPILGASGGRAARKLGADSLRPGSAVAAVLIDGDLSFNASGTVTLRQGNRIFAFGHPFTQLGSVAFPMAPATVVTTLADQNFAYKISNAGQAVGSVIADRVTAIVGDVGEVPDMLPVSVSFVSAGAVVADYSYRVVKNAWFTPVLVGITVANSVSQRWRYEEEGTYRLKGHIRLKGGERLELQRTYAVAPTVLTMSPVQMAMDVSFDMAVLYQNPIEPADVEAVELRYDVSPAGEIETLSELFLDPEGVRPGASFRVKLRLNSFRGSSRVVELKVPLPQSVRAERLGIRVVDARTLQAEQASLGSLFARAHELDELVSILAKRPRPDRFYVQLVSYRPDAVVHHERLPSLPPSVLRVLAQNGQGSISVLPRAVLWEAEVPVGGIALGAREVPVRVRQ